MRNGPWLPPFFAPSAMKSGVDGTRQRLCTPRRHLQAGDDCMRRIMLSQPVGCTRMETTACHKGCLYEGFFWVCQSISGCKRATRASVGHSSLHALFAYDTCVQATCQDPLGFMRLSSAKINRALPLVKYSHGFFNQM